MPREAVHSCRPKMADVLTLTVVKPLPDDPGASRQTPVLPSVEWSGHIARHAHKVTLCLLAMGLPYERVSELNQEVWLKLYEQHVSGAIERLELPGLALTQARYLGLAELRRTRLGPETPLEAVRFQWRGLTDPRSRPRRGATSPRGHDRRRSQGHAVSSGRVSGSRE